MKKDYRNIVIAILLVVLSFSLGLNFSKPDKVIGMATNYDKAATISALKTLDAQVSSKNPYDQEMALLKNSYLLPDSIYTDLMSSFRKENDTFIKMTSWKQ